MKLRSDVLATVLALTAAVGIGVVQPWLGHQSVDGKLREDVFVLPPPEQLRAMTLGYRSAAADLVWAKLLVEHGLHWQDKRKFVDLPVYIDGILALDPAHPTIYQFIDTLVLFQPVRVGPEEARMARRYLERGTKERPYDHELWVHYGQYLAFLAPSYLTDKNEIEEWRTEGARALMHAVELGADADRSLAASTLLTAKGETKATIEHLQKAYALTDDLETRRQIMGKLQRYNAGPNMASAELAVSHVEHQWRSRYPLLSRSGALLVGPYRNAAACAGPSSYTLRDCPRDWSAVVEER